MKILAIRGKNLASLSAEFVVDFESEPLASAGLYAITGPTGSGKSTLLDALCLALYERTPRLQKATAKGESIPDVGDNAVAPSDPRTLLRRGASEGYAEVDFVGSDGVAYRARWSARRAHAKAQGKLQASDITLVRIHDGQRLGDHTKTETLRLIEACIGLSFEQFTRAVLLAQNDFATFLKAPDDERAELLQTLTGSETFSDISRQAYARMKAENETLARLHSQLQDQLPMAAEARAEKDAALQARAAQTSALAAHKSGLEGHLRWYQLQAKHQDEVAHARAQHGVALAEQAAAAARHVHLARVEQVQGARLLWTEQERASQAFAAAAQTQADATAQRVKAEQQAQSSQSAFDAAQAQTAQAEAAKAELQPAIAQARELDAKLAALTPQCMAAEQAQSEAQAQLDGEKLRQAATAAHSSQAQADLQTSEAWLSSHAPLRSLSEGWQRWETLLASAQATLASQSRGQQEAQVLQAQAATHAQQLATAQSALEQAATQVHAATKHLAAHIAACAEDDTDALAQSKKKLEDQRDHLQAATLLWQQRCDVRNQRIRLQEQQQTHTATLAHSEKVLLQCAHRLPLLGSALHAADQALQLAQLAASQNAESLRAQLQPDEACPVCGALEHPYAEHAPALNAVLRGLQDHVAQHRQALAAAQEQSAVASASQASAAKAQELCSRELEQLAAQHAALLQQWSALALQTALDAVPQSGRSAWLQQCQEQARQDLAQLSAQEAQQRQNLKLKDAAQLALNSATKTLEQARDTVAHWTAAASQTRQALDSTQRQLTQAAQQLDATLTLLDSAFADASWRQAWQAAPDAFVAQCRSDSEAWAQQQDSSRRLTQRIAELQVQTTAAANACAQAAQQLATQAHRRRQIETTLAGYREQRGSLLQGRDVAEVEARHHSVITQARNALHVAQTDLQTVLAERVRLTESARLSAQRLEQLRQELGLAQTALNDWLERFNTQQPAVPHAALHSDALLTLLAIPPDWITQERQALQALQTAVTTAQAVLDTRSQSLAAHEAARATPDGEEALQAQLAAAHAELAALAQTLSALQLDLARDDERLAASTALRGQIEQQTAAAKVWSQLGELIGSADGKKFRNFAQQLTLDILLGYGNSHLQALSRRYRIQRIKDSLGLLVVDQDMGDEVRSVHSLSGGESFLVSLALALGLASLSSHRVRVESLFIDEGFGSLDADSLRVAMDALDSLQSLGRKVGVISHVQEMTERIGTQVQVQRQAGGLSRVVVG